MTKTLILMDEDFKVDGIVYVGDDGKAVSAKGNVSIDNEGNIIFPGKVTFADDCVMEWGIGETVDRDENITPIEINFADIAHLLER